MDISADPNDPDVQAIAAFLRVLNALENIRSSIDVAERGRTMSSVADLRDLAGLSLAETVDALEVLSEGSLARSDEPGIRSARVRLTAARVALGVAQHLRVRWAIADLLNVALQQLRRARSALADPATLPPRSSIDTWGSRLWALRLLRNVHLTLEVYDVATGRTAFTMPFSEVMFNPQPEPPEPIAVP